MSMDMLDLLINSPYYLLLGPFVGRDKYAGMSVKEEQPEQEHP